MTGRTGRAMGVQAREGGKGVSTESGGWPHGECVGVRAREGALADGGERFGPGAGDLHDFTGNR